MMLLLPSPVKRYLQTLSGDVRKMAYLRLDRNRCVDFSGGHLAQCGIESLEANTPIDEQIDSLVGLLPAGPIPVIIENAHRVELRYLDLHLFTELGRQWIVIFDNTRAALELQSRQQARLASDILEERKKVQKNST